MSSVTAVFVLLAVALLLVVGLAVWALQGSAVSRKRVTRFAVRQRVHLTTANAPLVVRAIAITHRWRRAGLALGFLTGFAVAATQSRLSIDFVAMFLGWFAGAVVGEWRISGLPVEGTRRVAALEIRSLSSYVTVANRVLLAVVAALLGLGAAYAGTYAVRDDAYLPTWLGWLGVTLGALAALGLTVRRVVGRPLAHATTDLRGADDALRGHALTVITGSAIAAAGLPLAAFLAIVGSASVSGAGWDGAGTLALLVLVVLGWYVASRSPSVRSRQGLTRDTDPVEA